MPMYVTGQLGTAIVNTTQSSEISTHCHPTVKKLHQPHFLTYPLIELCNALHLMQ